MITPPSSRSSPDIANPSRYGIQLRALVLPLYPRAVVSRLQLFLYLGLCRLICLGTVGLAAAGPPFPDGRTRSSYDARMVRGGRRSDRRPWFRRYGGTAAGLPSPPRSAAT